MTSSAKIGGIAILLVALLYLASFAFASPLVGLEDGDNPATSLEFIRQHSNFYFVSGLASVLAAITLRECFLKGLPEADFCRKSGVLRGLAAKCGFAVNQGK